MCYSAVMTQTKRAVESCGCLPYPRQEAERVIAASPPVLTCKAAQEMKPIQRLKVAREPVIVPLKPVRRETYVQYYAKLRNRRRRSYKA
jgi:hypothetical protein